MNSKDMMLYKLVEIKCAEAPTLELEILFVCAGEELKKRKILNEG